MSAELVRRLRAAAEYRGVPTQDLYTLAAEEIERLSERIVTVDIDGRVIRFDRVAECEAALDSIETECERLRSENQALRAASGPVGEEKADRP